MRICVFFFSHNFTISPTYPFNIQVKSLTLNRCYQLGSTHILFHLKQHEHTWQTRHPKLFPPIQREQSLWRKQKSLLANENRKRLQMWALWNQRCFKKDVNDTFSSVGLQDSWLIFLEGVAVFLKPLCVSFLIQFVFLAHTFSVLIITCAKKMTTIHIAYAKITLACVSLTANSRNTQQNIEKLLNCALMLTHFRILL